MGRLTYGQRGPSSLRWGGLSAERDERRVGGMAIVEGVFLRGPDRWAAASRRPDGEVAVVTGSLPVWYRRWSGVPLARGVVALAESLSLGVRALVWSGGLQRGAPTAGHPSRVARRHLLANLVPALVISIALFFAAPAAAAHALAGSAGALPAALVETALRIALVLAYLAGVGRLAEARRLFGYHGAEHQVVALHEAGLVPGVDAARSQPRSHQRCGTTFFVIVVFLSAIAHAGLAAFGSAPLGALLAGRVALVPLAAAAAYEVLLVVGRAAPTSPVRWLLRPGLSLQALTVRAPDDRQLEVALLALAAATTELAVPIVDRPGLVATAA